jgi:hypothetical protein
MHLLYRTFFIFTLFSCTVSIFVHMSKSQHKPLQTPPRVAARLEGVVKNTGIKNKKKEKKGG